jgi:hypothetical protein
MSGRKTITLRLDAPDYERLAAEAKRLGMARGVLARSYVQAGLSQCDGASEQRRRDGLAALKRLAALTADLPPVDAVKVTAESREVLEGYLVDGPGSEERVLVARWAALTMALVDRGLLDPNDLAALLIPSDEQSDVVSPHQRRRRLQAADEELRDLSKQLEASLRARYPDLFDGRGQLRRDELARRLSERTGGKRALSGDELRSLEEAADGAGARSVRAP